MILRTAVFLLNLLAGGWFVKKYLIKGSFFLSCGLFLGGYVTIIFYTLLVGLPLNFITINFPLLLLPFVFLRRKSAPASAVPTRPGRIEYIMAAAAVLVFILGAMHIMKGPIFERDGLGIWLTKAKAITLDRTFISDNFLDPWRIQDSPRYPLFLPLLEGTFMYQTAVDELAVKLVFVYIWFLILGLLHETIAPKSRRAALAAVIFTACIPAYYVLADGSLHTGYADIPISLFYLAGGILLLRHLQTGSRPALAAAGLCVAFSAFTKNEGWAFGLSVLVVLFLARRRIADIAVFLGSVLAVNAPWLLAMTRLPGRYQENYLMRVPEVLRRLVLMPVILKNAFMELVDVRHWGVFWPAVLVLLIVLKTDRAARHLWTVIAITVAGYLGIYLLTTWDITFQMSVSFPRLMLHVVPLIVMLSAYQFAAPENPSSRRSGFSA